MRLSSLLPLGMPLYSPHPLKAVDLLPLSADPHQATTPLLYYRHLSPFRTAHFLYHDLFDSSIISSRSWTVINVPDCTNAITARSATLSSLKFMSWTTAFRIGFIPCASFLPVWPIGQPCKNKNLYFREPARLVDCYLWTIKRSPKNPSRECVVFEYFELSRPRFFIFNSH